jgi:hypothetical protein
MATTMRVHTTKALRWLLVIAVVATAALTLVVVRAGATGGSDAPAAPAGTAVEAAPFDVSVCGKHGHQMPVC